MRDFSGDWDLAVARAVFRCDLCGQVAASVALLLGDSRTPGAGEAALEGASGSGLAMDPAGPSALIVESGFFGDWEQVVERAGIMPVAEALLAGDAAALYRVEPLWAPFHCPECRAVYCHDHWQMRVVYDEEWADWYDFTEGTCPTGHTRTLDD